MYSIVFRAMGCQMTALLDDETPAGDAAIRAVPSWFEEWEQRLSRFRETSELAQLNRAAGTPLHVSEILWQVIDVALDAADASDGLVTPTVIGALEAAGYDRSFAEIAAHGAAAAYGTAPIADWRAIERDADSRTVRLPHGIRLDLGGVAKVWAADTAALRLAAHGPALVDASGDIALSSPRRGGQPWEIGIADPLAPDKDRALLLIERGGVATSGKDYRRWQRDGRWQHHIIDPRTGRPAETDVLSATAIGPSACAAEIAAKVALILGVAAGRRWIDARPAIAGMLIGEDGSVAESRAMASYGEGR